MTGESRLVAAFRDYFDNPDEDNRWRVVNACTFPTSLARPEAHELAELMQSAFDGTVADTENALQMVAWYDLKLRPTGQPREAPPSPVAPCEFFVDWPSFWSKDRREAEWLVEDVLAKGRGHSIFAAQKTGKSLFMLWCAAELIAAGHVVIYLDYEQTEDDLYERLADMGHGPDTDLSRLRYALLPSLPPLDQPEGAKALLERIDAVAAQFPGAELAVVIDTTSRAVAGEENSADTIRNFYRWTGLHLKQRGITWARLDHAGKDATKGQRGSSAKGDDVDVVWRIARTEDGVELRREAARMGWVPERVAFHMNTNPLEYKRVAAAWPSGTAEVSRLLDELDVGLDVGERPAGKALREAGHKATAVVIRAAIRWRRQQAEEAC